MGSTIASAIRRRFVIGPLVAMAFVGYPVVPTSSQGLPQATASPSPTPTQDPRSVARDMLLVAMDAERVYYVDNTVFASTVGHELEELKLLEPRLDWGGRVVVEVPRSTGEQSPVVVLRVRLPSGIGLCLAEVTTERDAGTWYALAQPRKKCPKTGIGMRGWEPTEESGWAGT